MQTSTIKMLRSIEKAGGQKSKVNVKALQWIQTRIRLMIARIIKEQQSVTKVGKLFWK